MKTEDLFDEIDSKFKRIKRNTVIVHDKKNALDFFNMLIFSSAKNQHEQKRERVKEIIQRYRQKI